jgi:gas vesicle protein
MSYAGPASRHRGTARRPAASASSVAGEGAAGDEYHETDWQQVALFGAGLALGLALGAGAALLAAPQSGEETRAALRGRAKRFGRSTGRRSRDAWAELRDELQSARLSLRRRRAKRAARRAVQRELEREAVGEWNGSRPFYCPNSVRRSARLALDQRKRRSSSSASA